MKILVEFEDEDHKTLSTLIGIGSNNPVLALDSLAFILRTCVIPEGTTKLIIEMEREDGKRL